MKLHEALETLRKEEKRNFEQSVDLIINLRGLDLRKDNISAIATIPHPFQVKNVCGFLTKKSDLVRSVLPLDFPKYKDKKALKKLVSENDFFIAAAPLMPSVATTFGKVLGPTGKMPSPQLGVLMKEDDASIKQLLERINSSVKMRLKQPSLKVSVGKEKMKDDALVGNIMSVYNALVAALPTKKENVRSVMIKLTMSKPLVVEM